MNMSPWRLEEVETLPVCTYIAVFTFMHPGRCTYVYMLCARLYYDMCPSLHVHGSSLQPADRPIDQYVCTCLRPE